MGLAEPVSWLTGYSWPDAPSRPLREQWHLHPENPRLQLLGSGGFSPHFPNIPPALILDGFVTWPRQSLLHLECEKFVAAPTAK